MKQTDPQFKLRLPEKLKSQLDGAASEQNRSVSAEIVDRLEKSFLLTESVRSSFVGAHLAQELALAEMEKHRLTINITELAAMHRLLSKTLIKAGAATPLIKKYLDEWDERCTEIEAGAKNLLAGTPSEARAQYDQATEAVKSFIDTMKEAHEMGLPDVAEFFEPGSTEEEIIRLKEPPRLE